MAHGHPGKKIDIKSNNRTVFKLDVDRGYRIVFGVALDHRYLLFVGHHDDYDKVWQGKRELPSIESSEWRKWAIVDEVEAPLTSDEDTSRVRDKFSYAATFGTKGVLDNIVELTPTQQAIVKLNATGPVLIQGVAGSGKTALGLHRALHIHNLRRELGEETSILILTRTRALKTALNWLCVNSFVELNTEIDAFGDWMYGCLQASKPGITAISDSRRRDIVRQIREDFAASHLNGQALRSMSSSLLLEEIDDVIRGRDIRSLEEYRGIRRSGRRKRLSKLRRELLWIAFEKYTANLRKENKFDWAELPQLVMKHCNPLPRYDVVIVDEAQDLRPNYLRLAAKLVPDFDEHRGVTLLGDLSQSIQYKGVSWRDAGLPLRGRRTRFLKHNFRNSRQIIKAALPILDKCRHLGNIRLYHSPDAASKNGGKPVLVRYTSLTRVVEYISDEIHRLSKRPDLDFNFSNFAILSPRTRHNSELFGLLYSHLQQRQIPSRYFREDDFMAENEVALVTMQSATGLEFPVVFLIDFEEGILPYTGISSTPPEQIVERGRKLAYVSMTRASESLFLVCRKSKPSRFVDDILQNDEDSLVIVDV